MTPSRFLKIATRALDHVVEITELTVIESVPEFSK